MIIKNFNYFYVFLFNLLFFSCSDINFELPKGPKGDDGSSAYEIWKEGIQNGAIDWPKEKDKVEDFLVYIKGEKGDKGVDGKSAYQSWKEIIEQGNTPNPHIPTEMWSPKKIRK